MLAHGEHAGDDLLLMTDFIGPELTHEGFKPVYVFTYITDTLTGSAELVPVQLTVGLIGQPVAIELHDLPIV